MLPWILLVGLSCGLSIVSGIATILMSFIHVITISSFLSTVTIIILSNGKFLPILELPILYIRKVVDQLKSKGSFVFSFYLP